MSALMFQPKFIDTKEDNYHSIA